MDSTKIPNSKILLYKVDAYQGATFATDKLPDKPDVFDEILENTISHLKKEGIRGLWLKLHISKSNLIPIAVKYGFTFHHTKPDYMMLTHWLSPELNKLPHYATHYVGIGGIVINIEKDEILVMQERISLKTNLWKIPGGLVDEGEILSEAIEREVYEETGIKTKFVSIMAVREKKIYKFGQPDLYFIALLIPETLEIKIDPTEVSLCKWMPIAEFATLPDFIETQQKIGIIAWNSMKLLKSKNLSLPKEELTKLITLEAHKFSLEIGVDDISKNSENIFHGPNYLQKPLKD